jgi:hypothetical protein
MKRLLLTLALLSLALPASAQPQLTPQECAEGAEFIGNAARSRANGIERERFVEAFEADLVVLQGIPPAMRWFVYSDAEEAMLRAAVADVFDFPMAPAEHEAMFLARCLKSIGADPGDVTPGKRPEPATRDEWQRRT